MDYSYQATAEHQCEDDVIDDDNIDAMDIVMRMASRNGDSSAWNDDPTWSKTGIITEE